MSFASSLVFPQLAVNAFRFSEKLKFPLFSRFIVRRDVSRGRLKLLVLHYLLKTTFVVVENGCNASFEARG